MASTGPPSPMIPQPGPGGCTGESASEVSISDGGGTVPNCGPGPGPEDDDDSSDEVGIDGNPGMLCSNKTEGKFLNHVKHVTNLKHVTQRLLN